MTLTASETTPHKPPSPPSSRRRGWFAPLLLRLHFYAGILVGPFILIAAISGALYALTPQLEQAVYAEQLHAPKTETTLTLAAQIEAADSYRGDSSGLFAVRPAPEPGDTTRIMYAEARCALDGARYGAARSGPPAHRGNPLAPEWRRPENGPGVAGAQHCKAHR